MITITVNILLLMIRPHDVVKIDESGEFQMFTLATITGSFTLLLYASNITIFIESI